MNFNPDKWSMVKTTFLILEVTAFFLLPMLAPDAFAPDPARHPALQLLGFLISMLVPAGAVFLCWKLRAEGEDPRWRAALLLLFLATAVLFAEVHRTGVDNAHYFGSQIDNTKLQIEIHESTLHLEPVVPHSYRFLPTSFTRMIEFFIGSYTGARAVYRVTFVFLLLFWIHRFAERFVSRNGALAAVLLYCLVYPVTIRMYAGQLADPMSHLSFVLAFLALEVGAFPYFVLAVAIGALAKESVVAMVGFYLLFYRKTDPLYRQRAIVAVSVGLAVPFAARLPLLLQGPSYSSISGVGLDHLTTNLLAYDRWGPQVLFSVGIFVPFVVLGWRQAHVTLKRLTLFLAPVLFVSSSLFSWLQEARNFVPLIVPMAVISVTVLFGHGESPPRERLR